MKDKIINNIYVTTDYDKFTHNLRNRRLRMSRVQKLAENISKKGLKTPIRVSPDFVVLDGHHRLEATKLANEKLLYYIDNEEITTYEAAEAHSLASSWARVDYTEVYSVHKFSYRKLVELAKEYELTPGQIYILATNESWSSGENKYIYEKGEFCLTVDMIRKVREKAPLVLELTETRGGKFKTPILAQKPLQVISKMLELDGYNQKLMLKNLNKQHDGVLVTFNRLSDAARVLQKIHNSTKKGSKINLMGEFL